MSSGDGIQRWRIGPTPLAFAWLLAITACGDDSTTGGGGSGGEPQGGGGEQPGGGGTGGDGGMGGTGGMGGSGGAPNGGGGSGGAAETAVFQVSEGRVAFDAAPSPDGTSVYFTAIEEDGTPAIYEAALAGGATLVSAHASLVAPLGIATSTSGETLFIADAATDEAGLDRGAILALPASGGTPTAVTGTAGLSPRNLDVRQVNNVDQLYFTGRTAAGLPAIFRVPSGGGAVTTLVSNGLVDPGGITVASNGDLYVVDIVGSGRRSARLLFLQDGSNTLEEVVDDFDAGFPAGCALSLDESEVWISALDPLTVTTTALVLDTTSMAVVPFTGDADTDLSANFEPGGLHRAKDADTFGWVDARAGNGGTVYLITK